MCQRHIIHVNKNPGRVHCSSIDHRFCVSKQGVGLSHTPPPLKAHSWWLCLKKGDTVTQMATINSPQDITTTKQLFQP